MFKKRGQGQSWSLDIILALVVFVLIIGIFYALLGQSKKDQVQDLSLESKTIVSSLDSETGLNNELTIIEDGTVNPTKLQALYESDYSAIKQNLGVKGEFCIYLVDQYGNIVTVETSTGEEKAGFGSGDGNYTINGYSCGSALS